MGLESPLTETSRMSYECLMDNSNNQIYWIKTINTANAIKLIDDALNESHSKLHINPNQTRKSKKKVFITLFRIF